MRLAIYAQINIAFYHQALWRTYLAETLRLSMLLKAKSREVNTSAEHSCLGQNTDTTNTVNLHLHVRVTIGVSEVCKMSAPSSILRISFDDDRILIKSICKLQSSLRFLP